MKGKKFIAIIISIILTVSCFTPYTSAQEPEFEEEYAEGEVLFGYEAPVRTASFAKSRTSLSSQLKDAGVISYENLFEDSQQMSTNSYSVSDEPVVYHAKISGDVKETCKKLEKIDGITYAEPNYICHTDSYTEPVEISQPAVLYKNYQKWYIDDDTSIKATWEKYDTVGEGVTIAVIDNGFYTSASDFPTNLWLNSQGTPGWNAYDNNSDISPVTYPDGKKLADTDHGSNVAGIVGMPSNGYGGIGVSYNAELMLIKVATYSTAGNGYTYMTIASIANGINFAVNNNADLITMSIGTYNITTTLKLAADKAYSAGIPFFASAGNDNVSTADGYLNFPAAYENVIGVMASDKPASGNISTQLSSFSNYDPLGKYYDVSAPGVKILGCMIPTDEGNYSLMSGTSQATPIVAGCVALFLSFYPDATVDDVYKAVRNSPTQRIASNPAVVIGNTMYFKKFNILEMFEYAKVKPVIKPNYDTQVVLNNNYGYIYGLDEGFTDISDYISLEDGTGTMEFFPAERGNGTGSQLCFYDLEGELFKAYTVIIFGDINGDAVSDGTDSVEMEIMKNFPEYYQDYFKYAADVDFDNMVTHYDIDIAFNAAIGKDHISQTP